MPDFAKKIPNREIPQLKNSSKKEKDDNSNYSINQHDLVLVKLFQDLVFCPN